MLQKDFAIGHALLRLRNRQMTMMSALFLDSYEHLLRRTLKT